MKPLIPIITSPSRAILPIQGFLESDSRRSGMEDLAFQVIETFGGDGVVTYAPVQWTENMAHIAAQIARQGIREVVLITYSHGQAAACSFARHASKLELGITVSLWLACDPVYRPAWLPRWNILQPLAFRAMGSTAKIKVPHNIRRVAGVRQKFNLPAGHDLIPTGDTHIEIFPFLPYGHTLIDQSPEWFTLVADELTHWKNPPKAIPVPLEDM
jgi:hypothetical protein